MRRNQDGPIQLRGSFQAKGPHGAVVEPSKGGPGPHWDADSYRGV